MDLKEIQNLIKFVAKSGASEVKLEMDDVKITIKTGSDEIKEPTYVQQIPVSAATTIPAVPVGSQQPSTMTQENTAENIPKDIPASESNPNHITVKSPIIGTLYRKPSPDKPVFVEVGDTIKEGDVLCIIEAMKLFNEIESEVSGTIVKVLVDDSSPVEFDEPLFIVDPS